MVGRKTITAIITLILIAHNETARILAVFPLPSISHQVVFRTLTQELAKRGHELVILTTDPAFPKNGSPENITEIDLHDKSYEMWKKTFVASVDGKSGSYESLKIGFKVIIDIFEMQLQNEEVQRMINRKEKFDLLILEACVRSALVMSHIFKAPVIQISSFGTVVPNDAIIGAPSHPILYPTMLGKRLYNLTVWEKIEAAYKSVQLHLLLWSLERDENDMFERNLGPNAPTIIELYNNVDMLFLNINPIWEGNRPVPPGVIHMGGLHMKPEKELPKDLKKYLDNSANGVIYMSFGTNVHPSLLPPEVIQIFLNVFSRIPYDVLLKWDKERLEGKPNNVKIFKWLPQSDLLRHPKVKLFITQAGLQSTDEAIAAGVPLIAFPMLGDQWYNAEKYVYHRIGMKLDIETITEEVLQESIKTVIHDESYRKNVVKLGVLMRDQPQRPLERAVWWIEHVLRHGGARHLRSPAANISWSEYLELKLVVILLLSLIVVTAVFAIFSYIVIKFSSKYFFNVKLKHN